jgi:hypothetical protein
MTALDRNRSNGLFYLKTGCLLFWASWFSLACLTNVFDFMNMLALISPEWRFRSGNLILLSQSLSIYQISPLFINLLFICDVLIQALAGALFFIAAYQFWQRKNPWVYINYAFGISIALWAAFIVMEEIFIAYVFEGGHRELFAFELITLMAIHLLPQD